MSVRKTESRIPGGFGLPNISSFGQAINDNSTNPSYALISYLNTPVRRSPGTPFWNKYVVFVDILKVSNAQNLSYEWTVEFLDNTNNPVSQSNPVVITTDTGVLEFSSAQYFSNTIIDAAATCRTTVKINAVTLSLNQKIAGTLTIIEDFLSLSSTDFFDPTKKISIAKSGNRDLTTTIANHYRDYLLTATSLYGEVFKVPVNLAAAINYLIVYHAGRNENSVLEANLNTPPADWNEDERNKWPVGVCALKPHFAAMFIPKNGQSGAAYLPFQELDLIQHASPETVIFDQFLSNTLTENERIDIYNLLRFPKSNIRHCAFMLHKLKNSNAAWASLEKSDLAENRDCVRTIVSELIEGPHQGTPSVPALGKKVFEISWSPFIQKVIEPVLYENIKIKVLDIRSGMRIANAKVKKLIIRAEDANNQSVVLTQEFDYDNNSISESDIQAANGLVKETQRVLFRLGYYQNAPASVVDGSWDVASTDAYNAFWYDHNLDHTFDHTGGTAPQGDRMRFIIDEYNDHGYTNDSGVLNIRIPRTFLDQRKVSIETGFFEFPVVLEKLLNNQSSNQFISRNPGAFGAAEDVTGFKISWDGQDQQGNVIQSTDWANNLDRTEHFGWQVEDVPPVPSVGNQDHLRTCLKLTVKDDTQPFIEFDTNLFSQFYSPLQFPVSPYHFVVFGMQWCQPVWQPLPNTTNYWIEGPIHPVINTPLGLFAEIENHERNMPAVCTMYDASAGRSGQGRDYGMNVFYDGEIGSNGPVYDTTHFTSIELQQVYKLLDFGPSGSAPRSRGHHGIDYHAINHTTPVFAPYGSKVISTNRIGGYGKVIRLEIIKSNHMFLMAHLSENHNYTIATGEVVMSGRYMARAGRTDGGNTDPNSYYTDGPTHLHLEIARTSYTRRIADPKNIVQLIDPIHDIDENRNLFLNNYSNRLFPCDCHGGESITNDPSPGSSCVIRIDTAGTSAYVSSHCWASRNLHCPYLRPNNYSQLAQNTKAQLNTSRIQAQLTYLFEDESNSSQNVPNANDRYLSPGGIDGNWGNQAQAALKRFRWLHYVEIYNSPKPASENTVSGALMDLNNLTDADLDLDATWIALNQHAPYPRTNLNRVDQ